MYYTPSSSLDSSSSSSSSSLFANCSPSFQGVSVASNGRFVALVQQSQVFSFSLPPFRHFRNARLPTSLRPRPSASRPHTLLKSEAPRNTVLFRLDENPLAGDISDIVRYDGNGFRSYIRNLALAVVERPTTIEEAKEAVNKGIGREFSSSYFSSSSLIPTSLSLSLPLSLYKSSPSFYLADQAHNVLLSIYPEYSSIRDYSESSKGLLSSHFYPFIFPSLMELIKKDNRTKDEQYMKTIEFLYDATMEDFGVDTRYVLSSSSHLSSILTNATLVGFLLFLVLITILLLLLLLLLPGAASFSHFFFSKR
jgi:hypothetical protein